MKLSFPISARRLRSAGFSLIELLTVIAIISVLMTVGAIGVNSILGGKGTTSAVSGVESILMRPAPRQLASARKCAS